MNQLNKPLDMIALESEQPYSEPSRVKAGTLSITDFLLGISQLTTIGVIETTAIVEAIHREILLRPLGLLNHRYGRFWHKGISSRVYKVVRGITSLVGRSLTVAINQYNHFTNNDKSHPLPNSLNMVVNVLNGVMGDHLETNKNPLALPTSLYNSEGLLLAVSNQVNKNMALSGKVTIILHGLCMGYLNWLPNNENSLGQIIQKNQPDTNIFYLNYNTGRRISSNGREFSELLHQLSTTYTDISEINLIGHSMGGLVSRSALYYGGQAQYEWVTKTKKLITLGTPHHGAVLERIGNTVQQTISKVPFAGSLSKLGDIRSTGIIDLRHGSVRDEDWHSLTTRSVLPDDERYITMLPEHIDTYFLAATFSEKKDDSKESKLLGDGLVSISSALGEHIETHDLKVPMHRKAIFYGIGHLSLLTDKRVINQTLDWLKD
ncbi:alpha/beta hydrolase [Psychrobacter sp.]|uniref:PGAP1-like alpha/beta domain-containing protein n=1 Tax=Psychrobacter sp. TaxID=56811 RepID=UPI0025FAFD04|nr:alpha/beta hydrolase [Psychrobacter sp.]